jgi:hypothetical protein
MIKCFTPGIYCYFFIIVHVCSAGTLFSLFERKYSIRLPTTHGIFSDSFPSTPRTQPCKAMSFFANFVKNSSSWWMITHIQVEGSLYFISNWDFDTRKSFWTRFTRKYQHRSQNSTTTIYCQFNKKKINLQKKANTALNPDIFSFIKLFSLAKSMKLWSRNKLKHYIGWTRRKSFYFRFRRFYGLYPVDAVQQWFYKVVSMSSLNLVQISCLT